MEDDDMEYITNEVAYGDFLFPREQDVDVQVGDDLPDAPVLSVVRADGSVYVQCGHENVGSVTIRLAAHVARQLGWMLSQQAVEAELDRSVDYVLTGKGTEVTNA